jgi:hypothetical protein
MCPTGAANCGGLCRDLQTDRAHCGMCGNACGEGQACVAGACVTRCASGQTVCSGACADLLTDPRNCGSCGRVCASGLSCASGVCGTVCAPPLASCGGVCVDARNDPQHCGACGRRCVVANSVAACTGGACIVGTCDAGFGNCDGDSDNGCETNVLNTARHCGRCGRSCGSGEDCLDGACVAPCGAGEVRCNGACTNTQSSTTNCGACGNACMTGQTCAGGVCANTNGTVLNVGGAVVPVMIVACGTGVSGCTEAAARSACRAMGRSLVSHASNGATDVFSLGATTSCQFSISYFTNNNPAAAGQCLVGVSNSVWTSCCGTASWHGNTVRIPTTLGQQFGYVNTSNSGYRADLANTNGTNWGCQAATLAATTLSGCSQHFVACR